MGTAGPTLRTSGRESFVAVPETTPRRPGLNVVQLKLGWLDEVFLEARLLLDTLPPALREQTPARRAMRQREAKT